MILTMLFLTRKLEAGAVCPPVCSGICSSLSLTSILRCSVYRLELICSLYVGKIKINLAFVYQNFEE